MKKKIATMMLCAVMVMAMCVTAFAGQWKSNANGWWWENDDGSYYTNEWQWLDGDGDGISECYYFDGNGYCLINTTTPDGYEVDHNGAWTVGGDVQKKFETTSEPEIGFSAGYITSASQFTNAVFDELTPIMTERLQNRIDNRLYNISMGHLVVSSFFHRSDGSTDYIKEAYISEPRLEKIYLTYNENVTFNRHNRIVYIFSVDVETTDGEVYDDLYVNWWITNISVNEDGTLGTVPGQWGISNYMDFYEDLDGIYEGEVDYYTYESIIEIYSAE